MQQPKLHPALMMINFTDTAKRHLRGRGMLSARGGHAWTPHAREKAKKGSMIALMTLEGQTRGVVMS